jgi:DNA-binding response OmpR family regulator
MSTPAKPARILIAEDNPEGAELLEAYLDGTDYEVDTACDGEDTLRKVQSSRPDLILLDVMMPKISGFEVCKRLKANPDTSGIVILMITALDQQHDIGRAVEAGTNDFLTKPINKTELLLRIKAALQSRQQKAPLDQALAYIEGVQSAK